MERLSQRRQGLRRAPRWLRRLCWMVVLWIGGVITLAAVASVIRVVMHVAGMR